MTDRRVRIIRFYLLLAGLALACVLWPEWAVFAWPLVGIIPCPDCCGCTAFWEDDFSTDQLSTDYTTVSGTWAVGSGVLTTTSSGALIVADATSLSGHGRVSADGKLSSAGTYRLIGSYTNSSNYLFVEITINGASSTLKLWQKVAGADTQLGGTCTFTGATNTFYTTVLCWNGATAVATLTNGSTVNCAATGSYSGTGSIAGVGATPGGTATFDNLTFYPSPSDDSSCPHCGVSTCSTRCTPLPAEVTITLSGIVNGNCTTCDDYNATYVVPFLTGCQGGFKFLGSCNLGGGDPNHTDNLGWIFLASGSNTIFQTNLTIACAAIGAGADNPHYDTGSLGASPVVCQGFGTVAAPLLVDFSTCGQCDVSGSAASVVM